MATQTHSFIKHSPFWRNGECFYQLRQWLTMLVILLATAMLVSCSAKQDEAAIEYDTVTTVEEVGVSNTNNATIDYGGHSLKTGNSNPFYLLHQAFLKTKSQLWSVLELLLIIMLVLSVILYISEHIAQPNVYKRFSSSILWTFVKSIQDPGEMAPPKPISAVGRTVANIVGIVGVAIFALPAGIISSGFISAMDDEKTESGISCQCRTN